MCQNITMTTRKGVVIVLPNRSKADVDRFANEHQLVGFQLSSRATTWEFQEQKIKERG